MRLTSSIIAAILSLCALAACTDGAERDTVAAATGSVPPGAVVRAGCRQGECAWVKLLSTPSAEARPEGELRRILVRRGRSVHLDGKPPVRAADADIEWDERDRAEYAFCSRQRPAYAFPSDSNGLVVHYLDPFDLAGYQYPSANLYMHICHGLDRLPDPAALKALGYRPGTRSEQLENESVEALTRF